MVTMILCSYYKVWFPTACKWIFITAVCVHAVHILIFLCRNVFKGGEPGYLCSQLVCHL